MRKAYELDIVQHPRDFSGDVLELGAGVGICGLVAAQVPFRALLVPDATVCIVLRHYGWNRRSCEAHFAQCGDKLSCVLIVMTWAYLIGANSWKEGYWPQVSMGEAR